MKRFFATLLAALMLVSMIPVSVSAELSNSRGYMDPNNRWICGEATGVQITSSFVVELYDGDIKLATTTLTRPEELLSATSVTWHFQLPDGTPDDYWNTVWEAGHPNASNQPDKTILIVNGTDRFESDVHMYGNNDLIDDPYNWKDYVNSITPGYIRNEQDRIFGELKAYATESIAIELYAGETKIAVSTLKNTSLLETAKNALTWGVMFPDHTSSSWDTVWTAGHPRFDAVPDKVVLLVDGIAYAENDVYMNGSDDGLYYDWEEFFPEPELDLGLDKEVMELLVGETDQLTVTVSPEGYEAPAYTFESSNPAVATVDANGTVTAVAVGEASITLMIGDEEGPSCLVTVNEPEPETPVRDSFLPFIVTGVTQVKVIDAETEAALEGATFELYRISVTGSRKLHGTYTSNATGRITARTLSPRFTYELVMTAAPEGYDLLEAPVVFKVQYNRPLQQVVPVTKTVVEETPVETPAEEPAA